MSANLSRFVSEIHPVSIQRIGTEYHSEDVRGIINIIYLSVKKVSNTLPFSPIKHRNVRRESFLPCSR